MTQDEAPAALQPDAEIASRSAPPSPPDGRYPVAFDVDYPGRLSRWKTLLRGILIIPTFLFVYVVQGVLYSGLFGGWVAVFLRRRYPGWLYTAVTGAAGFQARLWAYATLLTDRYPSFEAQGSPVHLEIAYPEGATLSRWRVLFWKGVLLIPQFIVLTFLSIAVFVVVVIAWFAILVTGRYPRGIFGFVVGTHRWYYRVFAYFASFTDRYPPYSLSPAAGPADGATVVAGGAIGTLVAGGFVALIVVAGVLGTRFDDETVDYAALRDGDANTFVYYTGPEFAPRLTFQLVRVYDPADDLVGILDLRPGQRAIAFEWQLSNVDERSARVSASVARLDVLVDAERETFSSVLITVGNRSAPASVSRGNTVAIRSVFLVPADAEPVELRWRPGVALGFRAFRYYLD